jgi:glycosyltransferase involved in cell wall biosynthesis
MRTLRKVGYDVHGLSPRDEYSKKLQEEGFTFVEVPMDRKGRNPIEDLLLILRLYRLFRSERPDLILTYTAKPNIYGSLAALPLGIPVINTVPGLGHLFSRDGTLAWMAKMLYRAALRHSRKVFFQNHDDLRFFLQQRLVRRSVTERIPGTGVDTARFSPDGMRTLEAPFGFLLVSRLLWDKGVGEFVEAARMLKGTGSDARFRLLGFLDPDHPGAVSADQLRAWEEQGSVSYLGGTDDVASPMRAADCIVLPSYYGEGVPRTLLEGASLAKPLIAADSPGSRDIVDDGVNGFLCRPRDAEDLATKMRAMLSLDAVSRTRMGEAGREKVCREFDERIVIDRYLNAIRVALET